MDARERVNPVSDVTQPRAQPGALATETQRLARHSVQKQAALVALKKALLHQAFTGAL